MQTLNNFEEMFSAASDSGDALYENNELLGAYKDLTYLECRDIYRYWALGKRIASALPNFAMSAGRSFFVKNAPQGVNDKLAETANEMKLENIANRTAVYARIYGLSFIYLAGEKKNKAFTYKDFHNGSIYSFNVLDPLAAGGSISIENDPLSPLFGKVKEFRLKGHKVHTQRLHICYNDIPLYYKFNPSSFSFSGPSIYQNMTLLIRSWNRTIIALQRLATKAAAIILKAKDSAHITGLNMQAMQKNLELIRRMQNDGIAAIKSGEELEFFQLSGVSEIDVIVNRLNSALMMALSDTPSGILLDKNLSSGLADGSEDMKAILISVDRFRKDILTPIYTFLDKFLCYKAFSADFIEEMKKEYPDLYRDMSNQEILNQWVQDYSYEFNELYPQTESERADSASKQLDNLTKVKELGGELSGIEEALNNLDVFPGIDFVLDESNIQTQDESHSGGFGVADSEDEEETDRVQPESKSDESASEHKDS